MNDLPARPQPGAGTPGPRLSVRRTAASLFCVLLVATTAACTGEDAAPETAPSPGASSAPGTATETATPVAPAPPARVRVTRVSGELKARDQEVLADNVRKVVTAYFDDAYLGGDYPRDSFRDAFDTFSAGAARQADGDRDLLTNRVLGPTTRGIEVRRRTAYLSVLAPYKVAAGVTARVQLRFVADQGDDPAQLVNVKGRLLLTRKKSGGWQIFGYDLARSVRAVGEGS